LKNKAALMRYQNKVLIPLFRVFVETYIWYVADGNPRRTLFFGKIAICGWTQVNDILV